MKKESSKEYMKEVFDILDTIEKVEPNAALFQKIEAKIKSHQQDIVPMNWLKVAAVAFVCFISAEIYYTTNASSSDDELSSMIATIDNTLYDE